MISVSIIISTYNRPSALIASLVALGRQTRDDFEIVVGDDGSSEETAAAIETFRAGAPVPVKHVWQPDQGFRLAAVRNRAIERAVGEYLIITDGDCLFLPDAVDRHLRLAEPGWFVSGKRCYLRQRPTDGILRDPWRAPPASRLYWFAQSLLNRCTRPFEFLILPNREWRKNRADRWQQAQTCNLGVWRADALAIGGFDESYRSHGLEDSDFALRLLRHGVRRKRGDHALPVLHLNHPRPAGGPSPNAARFEALLASERVQARIGIAPTLEPDSDTD